MTNSFVEQPITAGQELTAAWGNHVQTQADIIESDLAAGKLAVAASQLTGTIATARMPEQRRSIWLSAAGGTPTMTNGCAPPSKVELPDNDIMLVSLNFDASTQEHAVWMFVLPDGYAGGAITPVFYWTAASGSGKVVWGIQGRSLANDEALDQALGTASEATDTLLAANDVHVVDGYAFTLAGTPAGGELCVIKVYRKAAAAGDTLAVDAKLIGVKLEFGASYSD